MTNIQRWILAFDASCDMCREVSAAVERASSGKLEVLPLTHADVRRWREQALGEDAAWAPTLVRVHGESVVRAWTGRAIAVPLARWLGPRSTVRVLQALGALKRADAEQTTGERTGMGRKQFLRLGAGAAAAATILITGSVPAFGSSEGVLARAWVAANKDRLPSTYDELAGHSLTYRRAIFQALPADVQSRLWVEHFDRWEKAYPALTDGQAQVLAKAKELVASEKTFTTAFSPGLRQRLADLREAAIQEFGRDKAAALLATLGSAVKAEKGEMQPDCTCTIWSDYCTNGTVCIGLNCEKSDRGCGNVWLEPCNGRCYN